MVCFNLSPTWFFGYDVALELFFAIISVLVAVFAYNVYRKSSQARIKYFSISFILIGISYAIQSLVNFLIITKLTEEVCATTNLPSVIFFNNYGLFIHMFFMILGYTTLVYATLKVENVKVLFLLALISILGIFFSSNIFLTFYLFSTLYLFLISIHFISNYLRKRQTNTLLVASAFVLLLFGSFHFLIAVNHELFYAIGHTLELVAYLLILTNFILVLRR